jgi:hypothetical protein
MRGAIEPSVMDSNKEDTNPADAAGRARIFTASLGESVWPFVLAFSVAAGYCWFWYPSHQIPSTLKDVLSAVTTVSASLFGFLLTSGSILVGIKGSWYKQRAKEAGLYMALVRNIFTAMWWCLTTSVLSIVARSYDLDWKFLWYRYGVSLWLFCAILALGATIRALRTFARLFQLIASE